MSPVQTRHVPCSRLRCRGGTRVPRRGVTVTGPPPGCDGPQGGWRITEAGPTWPGCGAFPGSGLPASPSPCRGLSPPQRPPLDTTPPPHWAGVPGARTGSAPRAREASRRGRGPPGAVSGTFPWPGLKRWRPSTGASPGQALRAGLPKRRDASLPAGHGLRTPAALPRLAHPEGRVGPAGGRAHPRQPQPAPCRSGTSPAGNAAPPPAQQETRSNASSRVCAAECLATPPGTQDAIRGGAPPDPDRGLAPCQRRQAFLAQQRWASGAADSGSEARADAGSRRFPGKGTGYPAPSPQTRTCAMNTSGSSVASSLRQWLTKQATPRLAHNFADPGPARCCGGYWVSAAAVSDVRDPQTSASLCGPCGCAC